MAFDENKTAEKNNNRRKRHGAFEVGIEKGENDPFKLGEPFNGRHCALSAFGIERLIKNADEIRHDKNQNKLAYLRRLKLARADNYPALDIVVNVRNIGINKQRNGSGKGKRSQDTVEDAVIYFADYKHHCKTDGAGKELTFEKAVRT